MSTDLQVGCQARDVKKNAARKESSQEKSHIQEQGLMTGSSCQAGVFGGRQGRGMVQH
jgi:hypothetical protein